MASGLLQRFEISTDLPAALKIAVQLPFFWHKKGATHYQTGTTDGFDWIELRWHGGNDAGVLPLPYPLNDAEKVHNFLNGWLEHAAYGQETDTDGSVYRGWVLNGGASFYGLMRLRAEWIVYGK